MTLQFRPNTAPKSLMLIIISLFVLTGVATTYGFVTVAVWPEHLARHVGQSMAFFGLLLGVAAVAACFVSQRRTAAVIMWRIAVGLIVLLAIFYVASIGVGKISALLLLTLAAWTLGNWLYLEKHPGADSVRVLLGLGLLAGTMGWTLAFKIHTSGKCIS